MIRAQIQKENGQYKKFTISGHAGYAKKGEDIVCAAVSALVINTVNSIETLTDDAFVCDCQGGQVRSFAFTSMVSDEARLLMDSLALGLKDIERAYGTSYLRFQINSS